jgi:ParB-like chromosome segregation protein Spo0J
MKSDFIKIEEIYVPTGHRKNIDPQKIEERAETMMGDDGNIPIRVRPGKGRYVLVEGIHRLEAAKALGEASIMAYIVNAKRF